MARRQRLSDDQTARQFDPPVDQRALVRYYTLSSDDLAAIHRCRGDHNKLGLALMRCYLQHPGRAMRAGERPPEGLLIFVAAQLGLVPGMVDEYIASDRNRQRHALESQEQLGLLPYGRLAATSLLADVPQHLLAFLSPLGWEHVNLTGDYIWGPDHDVTENTDGMKPLRAPPETLRSAA